MGASALATITNGDRYDQREVIETIKQTVAKGATDAQLKMFIEVCRATGLNPWLKEIWYVADKGIIMAARDGYLRVANENPNFDGIETRVERDDKNIPVKAVCTVWRKDRTHPTICEAYYSEYKKGSPVWTQYPSAMIGKVAEVLALKRSFSINGVVTEEEIGYDATAQGSRQAQQEVLDRKLADIRTRTASPAPAEEQPEPPPHPTTLDQVLGTFKNTATIEKAFSDMRKNYGDFYDETVYDQILVEGGMGPGESRTIGKAKACFKTLWDTLHKAVLREQEQEPAE